MTDSQAHSSHEASSMPHPLLKAEDIDAKMKTKGHYLHPDAKRTGVFGMSGLGVHKVRLPPHGESTRIHYHLHDSEWLYVLSGSGILQLIDASLERVPHPTKDAASITSSSAETNDSPSLSSHEGSGQQQQQRHQGHVLTDKYPIEEREISAGDFMGFQGGIGASRFAHGLKAGDEGIEYLMGGTRERIDICCYPDSSRFRLPPASYLLTSFDERG
ncbi:hypothetical protein I316_01233 [Kwoniella heveanensis BCC8398]|uniref:Uncharacterized protein n=1 Tax=Kwoniella heveanensis BCC8398 TaxID=1296120 RepID=A0A1B9H240_9TREE|nr:hypothetical protein I316_01233 [Kwoniella heveanensis BCC8398]